MELTTCDGSWCPSVWLARDMRQDRSGGGRPGGGGLPPAPVPQPPWFVRVAAGVLVFLGAFYVVLAVFYMLNKLGLFPDFT